MYDDAWGVETRKQNGDNGSTGVLCRGSKATAVFLGDDEAIRIRDALPLVNRVSKAQRCEDQVILRQSVHE